MVVADDLDHEETSAAIGSGIAPVSIPQDELEVRSPHKRRRSERIKSSTAGKCSSKEIQGVPPRKKRGKIEKRDPSPPVDPEKSQEEVSKEEAEPIDLSPLLTMPLDVFQEVLGHLHPKDLILASRVSRRFREHILSKNSWVWRRCRERIGAPDCPSDFSESAWAALLFVPRCQMCGTFDVHVVDFFIQRRLCLSCRGESLIDSVHFMKAYPSYSKEMLDLIPYTDSRVDFRSKLKDPVPGYYLIQDIESVASKLATYTRLSTPVSDGRTKLDIFKDYQKAKIRAMHRIAPSSLSWLHDQFIKQHIDGNVLSL